MSSLPAGHFSTSEAQTQDPVFCLGLEEAWYLSLVICDLTIIPPTLSRLSACASCGGRAHPICHCSPHIISPAVTCLTSPRGTNAASPQSPRRTRQASQTSALNRWTPYSPGCATDTPKTSRKGALRVHLLHRGVQKQQPQDGCTCRLRTEIGISTLEGSLKNIKVHPHCCIAQKPKQEKVQPFTCVHLRAHPWEAGLITCLQMSRPFSFPGSLPARGDLAALSEQPLWCSKPRCPGKYKQCDQHTEGQETRSFSVWMGMESMICKLERMRENNNLLGPHLALLSWTKKWEAEDQRERADPRGRIVSGEAPSGNCKAEKWGQKPPYSHLVSGSSKRVERKCPSGQHRNERKEQAGVEPQILGIIYVKRVTGALEFHGLTTKI